MFQAETARVPAEVLLAPLVAVSTLDLLRLSLACRGLRRLLFSDDPVQGGAAPLLAALARCAGVLPQHRPTSAESDCGVHLHVLNLSARQCGLYCAAMMHAVLPQPIGFAHADEVAMLLSARGKLSSAQDALFLGGSSTRRSSRRQRRSRQSAGGALIVLGPPVGYLRSAGEAWSVVDFVFDTGQETGMGPSRWQWIDLGMSTQSLRLGVQLQSPEAPRPEMRCVVTAATKAWVVLQAVSATAGFSFELSLAAGGFDSYDGQEAGWYFPREECSWRSSEKEAEREDTSIGARASSVEAERDGSDVSDGSRSLRVLLGICLALRVS